MNAEDLAMLKEVKGCVDTVTERLIKVAQKSRYVLKTIENGLQVR